MSTTPEPAGAPEPAEDDVFEQKAVRLAKRERLIAERAAITSSDVSGEVISSRRGELSIMVADWQVAAKAIPASTEHVLRAL